MATEPEKPKYYLLKEVVRILREAKYPQATERKIKLYAKMGLIQPRRIHPENPKSRYAYTDEEIWALRILFTFMLVYPLDKAGKMLKNYYAEYKYQAFLANDQNVAELIQAKKENNYDAEAWKLYDKLNRELLTEEAISGPDKVWEYIQDTHEQITQAFIILKTLGEEFTNASQKAFSKDRVELAEWRAKALLDGKVKF